MKEIRVILLTSIIIISTLSAFCFYKKVKCRKPERVWYKSMSLQEYEQAVYTDSSYYATGALISVAKRLNHKDFFSIKNPRTACKIAMAILEANYTLEAIKEQMPFSIYLVNNNVWEIKGKGPYPFLFFIQKADGKILGIKNVIQYKDIQEKDSIPTIQAYHYCGRKKQKLPFQVINNDTLYQSDSSILSFPHGLVNNLKTAAQIGIANLTEVYGYEDCIKQEYPFHVVEYEDEYIIEGNYPSGYGGAALIGIAKENGMVIDYNHGE